MDHDIGCVNGSAAFFLTELADNHRTANEREILFLLECTSLLEVYIGFGAQVIGVFRRRHKEMVFPRVKPWKCIPAFPIGDRLDHSPPNTRTDRRFSCVPEHNSSAEGSTRLQVCCEPIPQHFWIDV